MRLMLFIYLTFLSLHCFAESSETMECSSDMIKQIIELEKQSIISEMPSTNPGGKQLIGLVKSIGSGTVLRKAMGDEALLVACGLVYSEDKIDSLGDETGSSTVILFLDNTILTVGPRAEVKLDQFVFSTRSSEGESSEKIVKGIFRVIGGKILKAPSGKVTPPLGTMGIRG